MLNIYLPNNLNMKKILFLTCAVLAGVIMIYSCKSEAQFKSGMTVAAKWTDNNYYLATITSLKGDRYEVDYADGTKGDVALAEMKMLAEKESIKVGDKVLAVWSGAKFYAATIKELKAKGAVVTWDDGTAESEVDYGKIMKLE
jgi:hypothetical protein